MNLASPGASVFPQLNLVGIETRDDEFVASGHRRLSTECDAYDGVADLDRFTDGRPVPGVPPLKEPDSFVTVLTVFPAHTTRCQPIAVGAEGHADQRHRISLRELIFRAHFVGHLGGFVPPP